MTKAADLAASYEVNQKTRGRHAPPRRFDRTQLHIERDKKIHRDFGAHFFRWAWVSRRIKPGERILDVGCGQDQPLVTALWSCYNLHHSHGGIKYVGVDLNRIKKKIGYAWVEVRDEFDFTADYRKLGRFHHAACLEVLEHMTVPDGRKLLRGLRACLLPEVGRLYLSTPVFSGIAAANHIHEYTVPELTKELERAGFKILERYGTFAKLPKIRKAFTPEERKVHDRLAPYYGNDALSIIFAPPYPDLASNNLWVLAP